MPRQDKAGDSRTTIDIKRAFVTVLGRKPLADITISEVAQEAHVSRSTFYQRYRNLGELYDEMVREFSCSLVPQTTQAGCTCVVDGSGRKSLCSRIREGNEYESVIKEDRFLPTFLGNTSNVEQSSLIAYLMDKGFDFQQASALFLFQTSGCFMVSTMLENSQNDWPKIQQTIDRFVQGGLAALSGETPPATAVQSGVSKG